MQKEWFEAWFDSPFYPVLYDNRDEKEAGSFVAKLIAHLAPKAGSRMVDIACGNGRYAQQLAGYGHEVIGIDLSEQRIEEAKNAEHDKLHFYVHDMRFPFYINYFDYAFNFFTSFGYFDKPRDNQMAAHAFAAALRPGGILVIDYFNEEYAEKNLVPQEDITRNGLVFHIKRYIEAGKIVKDISVKDDRGRTMLFQERVSAFDLTHFLKLFEGTGMMLAETFGDYNLQPFVPEESPRLIMVFRKENG